MNYKAKIKRLLIYISFFSSNVLYAQNDSLWNQRPMLNISGLLDVYYVYDFNQPQGPERQPFLYNHNRHNEMNLNLGFVKLGLEHSKYRANLALHTGTYSNDNYSNESGLLKNIFEANVGLSLNRKNNLWLDAGTFASHIGFESAISTNNWTMTRSLLAENSPYFLSGAKLTYSPNAKYEVAGLVLNGWQRIQRLEGNSLLSIGSQIIYKPSKKSTFNWSTFIGSDDPDTTRRMRYFNNIFGQFQVTEKFGLILGFDIGAQQKTKGSTGYNHWFSPVIIAQYSINNSWKTAVRAEYYEDEKGVIIPSPNGFKTSGLSLNFDYAPAQDVLFRVEGRWIKAKDQLLETGTSFTDNNFILATSIVIRFSESMKD